MTARRLEIFVIIVIIAVIGIVFAFKQNLNMDPALSQNPAVQNDQTRETDESVQVPASVITYQGQDGKNALELLQAAHRVEVKSYSFGDLVTSINGIAPDSTHFWAMYVNGQFSQVGASAYQTKSTDQIRWQIDAVNN